MGKRADHLLTVLLAAAVVGVARAQQPHAPIDPGVTGTVTPIVAEEPRASDLPRGAADPAPSAEALRRITADFHDCLARLWPLAARRGIARAHYVTWTQSLAPDARVLELMDNQPEFTRPIWDYLDLLVNDARIEKGRALLARYRATFDAVERAYGVDRAILAAIWGVESDYGTRIGERPVLRSTATLACFGRRQNYFRGEFLAALEILEHGDVRPERLVGSWAGAFGPTQFMPTSFRRYAVDFDHDGRRDVVDSIPDAIASTANNLRRDGWIRGQNWGYEVVVPADFDFMLADGQRRMAIAQWRRLGLVRAGGRTFPRPDDEAFLLVPAGVQGPAFLMLHNFRVIMKYNPAEAYALAIGHLADRLRGGGPFVQPWPRYERALSRAERLELQQRLARRGYDVGAFDGDLGVRTRAAVRDFQAEIGRVPDGFATVGLLERLRGR